MNNSREDNEFNNNQDDAWLSKMKGVKQTNPDELAEELLKNKDYTTESEKRLNKFVTAEPDAETLQKYTSDQNNS